MNAPTDHISSLTELSRRWRGCGRSRGNNGYRELRGCTGWRWSGRRRRRLGRWQCVAHSSWKWRFEGVPLTPTERAVADAKMPERMRGLLKKGQRSSSRVSMLRTRLRRLSTVAPSPAMTQCSSSSGLLPAGQRALAVVVLVLVREAAACRPRDRRRPQSRDRRRPRAGSATPLTSNSTTATRTPWSSTVNSHTALRARSRIWARSEWTRRARATGRHTQRRRATLECCCGGGGGSSRGSPCAAVGDSLSACSVSTQDTLPQRDAPDLAILLARSFGAALESSTPAVRSSALSASALARAVSPRSQTALRGRQADCAAQ